MAELQPDLKDVVLYLPEIKFIKNKGEQKLCF
jgi:hypothetical protein